MHAPSQLIGSLIDGKYKIDCVLGQGGMGTVYLAQQSELSRELVVKVLNFNLAKKEEFVERFHREARILASMQNEHLMQVYSYGLLAGQVPYLAMERVSGITLGELVAKNGKLAWQRAVKIGIQICDAMSVVHAENILHRDLKPSNVMILDSSSEDEQVKVIDFGLGCFLGSDSVTLTKDGTLLGTPQYMSPEVCSGERSDQRSDIYGLACLLYESISGVRPFLADNAMGLIYQHKNELPPLLSAQLPDQEIPVPELDAVILRGLEKLPENRYGSMSEFSEALSCLLNRQPLKFDPYSVSALSRKSGESSRGTWASRRKSIFVAGFVCLLSLFLFVFLLNLKQESTALSVEESLIHNSVAYQKKALAEEKRGNIARAKDYAYKALRFLVKELLSKRDTKLYLNQELLAIDGFKPLGQLMPSGNFKKRFVDLEPVLDSEERAEHYHNLAELYLLSGKVKEFLSDHYPSFDAYLQASRAFAKNNEIELAKKTLKNARDFVDERTGNAMAPTHAAKISLTEAANLLVQGKKAECLQLVSKVEANPSWAAEGAINRAAIQEFAGELCQQAGELAAAKHWYEQALESLNYKFGKAPFVSANDGAYVQAFRGLADIALAENDLPSAIRAKEKLAEHFKGHADISKWNEAADEVEKLKAKLKSSNSLKTSTANPDIPANQPH